MNEKELAIAMYTINKYAKIYPLARNLIKDVLFEDTANIEVSDEYIRSFANILFQRAGFSSLSELKKGFHEYGEKSIDKYAKEHYSSDIFEKYDLVLSRDYDENDDALCRLTVLAYSYEDCMLDNDIVDECSEYFDSESLQKLKLIAEEQTEIANFYNKVDKVHELLKSTKYVSQNLYSLKEATIKTLNLSPVGYHKNNDPYNILILYSFAGFSFHLPISKENLNEPELNTNSLKEIDIISAEIKLPEDKQISLEDAIKVLLSFHNLDEALSENILFQQYDTCFHLHIERNKINRPQLEDDTEIKYSHDYRYYDDIDDDEYDDTDF